MNRSRILAPLALALVALAGACAREDEASEPSTPVSTPGPSTATTAAVITSAQTTPPGTTPDSTVAPTTGPASSAVESTAPTSAPPTTEAADTTTAPTGRPVLVQWGNAPIAVWDGSWQLPQWDDAGSPLFARPSIPAVGTGLGSDAPVTGGVYGAPEEFCYGFEMGYAVTFPGPAPEGDRVNVDADWNVQPRPVEYVSGPAADLQSVGEALVDPVRADPGDGVVSEVARVDLDGDGSVEVLFTFEHQTPDDQFGTAGDFTLMVVRHLQADGTTADQVLWSFYEEEPIAAPNPSSGWLIAIADFNGDGVMEVVTGHTYWESSVASVYALSDHQLTAVSGGGCGT